MVELSYATLEGMSGRDLLQVLEQLAFLKISYQNEGVVIMKKERLMEEMDGRC